MTEFKSPDEIAQILFSEVSEEGKKNVLSISDPEGMIEFHHSVGREIRNRFGLWNEKNPYTVLNPEPNNGVIDHPNFPDQVSHEILKKVWKLIHDEKG